MIAIITGDIVNSSTVEDPQVWLDPLKELFERISPHPGDRMIYRGDSFQIKVLPEKGLRASLLIISTVVALDIPGLNVRQAIRSEEHTSELQSRGHRVGRLLLDKK